VLLVGETGVGKTASISYLAQLAGGWGGIRVWLRDIVSG